MSDIENEKDEWGSEDDFDPRKSPNVLLDEEEDLDDDLDDDEDELGDDEDEDELM